MSNYLHWAGGLIADAFPWSFRIYSTAAASESAAETAWHTGVAAMFSSAGFNGLLPSTVELTETYTSTMNAAWKQTTKTVTNATIAGTGSTALPYHTCEVVTLRSAQATRYGRGRIYLPCLSTAALAAGGYYLSSTAVGDIVTAVNALLSSTAGTLQFVLLHRKGTKSGPGALTTDNIVSGDVPDGFDVQRRRADKRVPARTSLTF